MSLEYLLEQLRSGVVHIEHTTLANEHRTRRVTLAMSFIPDDCLPKGVPNRPLIPGHLRVFDVDLQQWRTVITDSVNIIGESAQ